MKSFNIICNQAVGNESVFNLSNHIRQVVQEIQSGARKLPSNILIPINLIMVTNMFNKIL